MPLKLFNWYFIVQLKKREILPTLIIYSHKQVCLSKGLVRKVYAPTMLDSVEGNKHKTQPFRKSMAILTLNSKRFFSRGVDFSKWVFQSVFKLQMCEIYALFLMRKLVKFLILDFLKIFSKFQY